MITVLTRFTDDPLAPDSAQFPLARPMGTIYADSTSLPIWCSVGFPNLSRCA